MRLGKMYEIIQNEVGNLNIITPSSNGSSTMRIDNAFELRKSIETISTVVALNSSANIALPFLPFLKVSAPINVPLNQYNEFSQKLNILRTQSFLLLEAIGSSISIPEKGNFYFKIPHVNDLSELNKDVETLNKALKQIFGTLDNSINIQFKGFDTGSEWLVLHVGLSGIAALVYVFKSSIELSLKMIELKKSADQLEEIKAEQEIRNEFRAIQKKILDAFTESEVKKLIKKLRTNDDSTNIHEDIKRVGNSLNEISSLFARGANYQLPKITYDQNNEINISEINQETAKLENALKEVLLIPENSSDSD